MAKVYEYQLIIQERSEVYIDFLKTYHSTGLNAEFPPEFDENVVLAYTARPLWIVFLDHFRKEIVLITYTDYSESSVMHKRIVWLPIARYFAVSTGAESQEREREREETLGMIVYQ